MNRWDESYPVFRWCSSYKSHTIMGCISLCHWSLLTFPIVLEHFQKYIYIYIFMGEYLTSTREALVNTQNLAKQCSTFGFVYIVAHWVSWSPIKNKQTLRSRPFLQVWPGQWRHQHTCSFIGQPNNRKTIVKHVLFQSAKCICNEWV